MERLTKRFDGYAHGAEGRRDDKLTGRWCRGIFEATALVERLAYYEDLRDQGKMVIPPCAVGDTVYSPLYASMTIVRGIEEMEVLEISNSRIWAGCDCFDYDDIGKTVFLTRKEAEEALERIINE